MERPALSRNCNPASGALEGRGRRAAPRGGRARIPASPLFQEPARTGEWNHGQEARALSPCHWRQGVFHILPPRRGDFCFSRKLAEGLKAPCPQGDITQNISNKRRCYDEKDTLHTHPAADTGAGAFGLWACTDTNSHANACPADRHAHACSTHSNAHACSTHPDANAHASSLPYDHHRYGRA